MKRRAAIKPLGGDVPEELKQAVFQIRDMTPKLDAEGREIRVVAGEILNRMEGILRDHPAATPEVLVQAWRAYLRTEPRRIKAPQYFFGKQEDQGATGANWFTYARVILIDRQAKAEREGTPAQAPQDSPPAEPRKRKVRAHLANCLVGAGELVRMQLPPREMIVDPWLPVGSLAMVYAPRGIGKTWFVGALSEAVSKGVPFFAWRVPSARRVLFVDGEMPLGLLQERFAFLSAGQPSDLLHILPSERLWMEGRPLNLRDAGSQSAVDDLLEDMEANGIRPDLIILDNISSLTAGADSNSNDDLDGLIGWLMRLRHQGYSVMQVHHAGKGGDQRGASRREDQLDTSIRLSAVDGVETQGATFTVEFTKERGIRATPSRLTVTLTKGPNGEAVWSNINTAPKWLEALQAIAAHAPETVTELGKILGTSRQAAAKHVENLRAKGFIGAEDLIPTAKGKRLIRTPEDPAAA